MTAVKALGLEIRLSLLLRADEVIEYWPQLARSELGPVIKPRCRDRRPWGGTRPALARQRLASEADNLEAGDVGHLRTVGGP